MSYQSQLSTNDWPQLHKILAELKKKPNLSPREFDRLLRRFPKESGGTYGKDELVAAYRRLSQEDPSVTFDETFLRRLQMKPIRTASGVTPVTVLTKPFPCPGKCIFCPNDIRMPKSYLSDEPGAQRAERNYFDPYLQTYNRLQALHNIGHEVAKIEIIVLGGTWSYYPEAYQIWFIKECFRALNEFGVRDDRVQVQAHYQTATDRIQDSGAVATTNAPAENKKKLAEFEIDGQVLTKTYNQVVSHLYVAPEKKLGLDRYQQASWETLEHEQKKNETAQSRCVGLVIETRPDNISEAEVIRVRRLGCTKTQIGVQSLQDTVLDQNKRGHDVAATRHAFRLLRQAGFKIHAHWMANLYGSSVAADMADYDQLFADPDFRPDELKIYPCSLIASAELMQEYQAGRWKPYTKDELLQVVGHAMSQTPRYCRLTRVIRDIPSTDIVDGNMLTNFRQLAEKDVQLHGLEIVDIRSREIRLETFDAKKIALRQTSYQTTVSTEVFLEYVVPVDGREKLLGFLRLSLPTVSGFIDELAESAIIREVHVYGQTVAVGKAAVGKAQHLGLGKKLLDKSYELTQAAGFKKIAVISSVGTREYYRQRGFEDGDLYQLKTLSVTQSQNAHE